MSTANPNNTPDIKKRISVRDKSFAAMLAAAFVAATTHIGPAFTTQTAVYSHNLLGAFLPVIACVLILDFISQRNIYRVTCYTNKRGQEVADALKPGLGFLFSGVIMFGIFFFEFGNIAGCSLGIEALTGLSPKVSMIFSGLLAIIVLIFKSANRIVGILAQILGAFLIIASIIVAYLAKPPIGQIVPQITGTGFSTLILPILVVLGATAGGYAPVVAPHRLLAEGLGGKENFHIWKTTQNTSLVVEYSIRVLLFLCTFGVVMAGIKIDLSNPSASSFQAVLGEFGLRFFGLVLTAVAITSVLGAVITFTSLVSNYSKWVEMHERYVQIGVIIFCTFVNAFIGRPIAILILVGVVNAFVMPFLQSIVLLAAHNKRVVGPDYRHPVYLTIGGIVIIILTGYFSIMNVPTVLNLFR